MEFLRYPQLIPHFFNSGGFGPPRDFTLASTWPWIGHPVSGHIHDTLCAINTRFPFGSEAELLNLASYIYSPDHSTKGTPSHCSKEHSALTGCKHRVSGSVSLPSRGSFHLSLTVLSAIGHQVVFRLGGWSPLLPNGFHGTVGTLDTVS